MTHICITLCFQVTMTNKEAAERACKDPNPVIDGRKANVNLAYIGAKPRIMQTTGELELLWLLGDKPISCRHAVLNFMP